MLIKNTKRYMLIFQIWWYEYPYENQHNFVNKKEHRKTSYEEFDTIEELHEAMRLYDEIYKDTPVPYEIESYYYDPVTGSTNIGRFTDSKINNIAKYVESHIHYGNGVYQHWGYVTLDFEKEKILGQYHTKFNDSWKQWRSNLGLLNTYFLKDGEIPKNYVWDEGEYEGWLQYRWGNGLNKIEIEDEINRKAEEKKQILESKQIKEQKEKQELMEQYGYTDNCDDYEVETLDNNY